MDPKLGKYDDASWHLESVDPTLPEDERWARAGAHIALLFRWCVMNDLIEPTDEIEALALDDIKKGRMSATSFLDEFASFKFVVWQVKPAGRAFLGEYYGDKEPLPYLTDIEALLGDKIYQVREEDVDFASFSAIIDRRFASVSRPKGEQE